MQSVVLQMDRERSPGAAPDDLVARSRAAAAQRGLGERSPHLVLAFLPPGAAVAEDLEALERCFPDSLRVGCEAVTQFAGERATDSGTLQLFWLENPAHGVEALAIHGARSQEEGHRDFDPAEIARAVEALRRADAGFLLCDGLRFPAWELLEVLRAELPEEAPPVVGGLASQMEPISDPGARVFLGREVFESACILTTFRGIEMDVEIVRGWDPASPIFTITRAEGNVVWAIDDEPAPDFFRRFFTVEGELAPMPEAAHRFPLIIEGPRPERRGIYRSLKAFDHPPGAVSFWGDFEPGDQVRLGMGNDASLLRTAGNLFAGRHPEAAVLYSCVGREAVLGDLADREVATIHGALRGAALAGFFTFGEIGPPMIGGGLAFYNQTAVLALLQERAG